MAEPTNVIPLRPAKRKQPDRARLNEEALSRLPEGKELHDKDVFGFYAKRGKRGITFHARADLPTAAFRLSGRKTPSIEMAIGKFGTLPGQVTAKAARTKAREVIAFIKAGTDPNPKEVITPIQTLTLKEAWPEFKAQVLHAANPKTLRFYEHCIARLAPHHGKALILMSDITWLRKEFARLRGEHGEPSAAHTIKLLARIYRWKRIEHPGEMPALELNRDVIKFKKPNTKAHLGLTLEQLPEWWSAAQKLQPIKREMLLFSLLSGMRPNDVMTARHSDLRRDNHGEWLHVPAPKFHREDEPRDFDLPVTPAMRGCIDRAQEAWRDKGLADSQWLFPSDRAKKTQGRVADSRAQYRDGAGKTRKVVSGHLLRHTFTNVGRVAEVQESDVGILMNHKPRTITGQYAHSKITDDPEHFQKMMRRMSDKITGALGL